MEITLEALENLAAQIEAEEGQERDRLKRLITAYARILRQRQPELFRRKALEYSDEDGHYDNSYPPSIQWKDHNGPAVITVMKMDYTTAATEGGFYHDYRFITVEKGIYVGKEGTIYGATIDGTGHFGQFAAHPGDCNVMATITYEPRSIDTKYLQITEEHMRKLAFPLIAAQLAKQQVSQD
jgi:hypothetical protein